MDSEGAAPFPCPLCRDARFHVVKEFVDPPVQVARCCGCGLLYTPRRHPAPHELFPAATAAEMDVLSRPILEGRFRHFRANNFEEYLQILERATSGRRLLDVGCAHGFFPALAARCGWSVVAVEPNEVMATFARTRLGLRVLQGRLADVDLAGCVFDAVSFTDSAEYLPDPVRDIGKAASCLAPGGILFVKVPNGDYFRLRHGLATVLRVQGGEEAFSPPQRVAHYTLATLRRLAAALGLDAQVVRSCRPVDSPVWFKHTGLWLEVESPWWLGTGQKALRRLLQALGRVEQALTGQNHLSPAIYLLARRKSSS